MGMSDFEEGRRQKASIGSGSCPKKLIQPYQLNHSHENADHNEAGAEDSLAAGGASAQSGRVGIAGEHHKESQASNDSNLAPEALLSPCGHRACHPR